eukprot:TRINITY_DN41900_c0_g1_i1.p1 TRINITY_DN41900_c0_g1~~TRINITY_DN41900_c0_g1_i1.p1  ORF type:complete len:1512 (+),score=345.39 TRINITY_DN41900_c0_g1_i1:119-4654(+)
MLAVEETQRFVVLCVRPDLLLRPSADSEAGKTVVDDICARFQDEYYELRCRKQVQLSLQDANSYFKFLSPAERAAASESFARGLCEVAVFDDLYCDDDVDLTVRTSDFFASLLSEWGAGSMYCSTSDWECLRDLEFFFPFLDALPTERTLALIKPDGLQHGSVDGQMLEEVAEERAAAAGLLVVRRQEMELTLEQAQLLCKDMVGKPNFQGAVGVLRAEPGVVAMCLEGRGAVGRWKLICGPSHSGLARQISPESLRAVWGTDGTSNALHSSDTVDAADEELAALFGPGELERTLCIIQSKAVPLVHDIFLELEAAGFTVIKHKKLRMSRAKAEELLAVREGDVYYKDMLEELLDGPCVVAVLLRVEAVSVLHQLMGPAFVEEARRSRPRSLRARYGSSKTRNSFYGSASPERAAWEVRLFFPDMTAGTLPSSDEIQDFLFRKGIGETTKLKTLSEAELASLGVDPTLMQLLRKGIWHLAQEQPKGVAAATWLSRWLAERKQQIQYGPTVTDGPGLLFDPPHRGGVGVPRFSEHGINKEGMPFSVEPPVLPKAKKIIEVDTALEAQAQKGPYVVFVCGGPSSGKSTLCARLAEELSFVDHVDFAALLQAEEAAGTHLGTEIYKYRQAGAAVPDGLQLQLLTKRICSKQGEPKRCLLDGFPATLEQAKGFEREIGEVAFILHVDAGAETLQSRPGGVSDAKGEERQRRAQFFDEVTSKVLDYYGPIGKVRNVNAEMCVDEAYSQVLGYTSCRLVYLIGTPGMPLKEVAKKLEDKYGYSAMDVSDLLRKHAATAPTEDAEAIHQALAQGLPVAASVAAPVVVSALGSEIGLGLSNFVLTGFPESQLQEDFVTRHLPSFPSPLYLDMNVADAQDLADMAGLEADIDVRLSNFFGKAFQNMLQPGPMQLRNLVRIPCDLGNVSIIPGSRAAGTRDVPQRLLDPMWLSVCAKVKPGLTIVMGPPASGSDKFAGMIASASPKMQAVDCNLLVEREMERCTETGFKMRELRERGEVIPLCMTLELLKDIVNLTCSDSLVVDGLPTSVDQIPAIQEEFRIDQVYCLQGSEKAVQSWQARCIAENEDGANMFDDYMRRASPIAAWFARRGMLQMIDVGDTPLPPKRFFSDEIKKASVPQYAIVTGLSESSTPQQGGMVAKAFGVEPCVSVDYLEKWVSSSGKTLTTTSPKDMASTLRRYANTFKHAFVVLDRYPRTQEDATALINEFGLPRVVVNIDVDDEALTEEFNASQTEEENPLGEEEVAELLKNKRSALDSVVSTFSEKCPNAILKVPWAPESSHEELLLSVRRRLRPRSFAIVSAPGGPPPNLGCRVADAICAMVATRTRSGAQKYTVLDSNELVKAGRHKSSVEDHLAKATVSAAAPESLSARIWSTVFQEAFENSTKPMGRFLVTNFPTPGSSTAVRDQFHLLAEVSCLLGVLHVKLGDDAFTELCSQDPHDLVAYRAYQDEISWHCTAQFHEHEVLEYTIEEPEHLMKDFKKIAENFRTFQVKVENEPPRL